MKRIAQFCVFVLFTMFLFTIPAKADEDGTTVYFYNALGWKEVYVYSWTEGSNAPELTPMEAMEKKNWYQFTFAPEMGKKIDFVFYNGEWGETNQTRDIKIKNGKDKYYYATKEMVNTDNGNVADVREFKKKNDLTADYKEYRKELAAAEANKKSVKIYFRNDDGWKKVYIWAWKENNINIFKGKYPGKKMKKYNDEWYVCTFESDKAFQCVFSNGSTKKNKQTGDCEAIMPGGTYWITLAGGNKVEANENGFGAGFKVAINRAPQPGWPEGKQLTPEEIESSKEAAKISNMESGRKKNGIGAVLPFIIGLILITGVGIAVNNNHKKNNTLA